MTPKAQPLDLDNLAAIVADMRDPAKDANEHIEHWAGLISHWIEKACRLRSPRPPADRAKAEALRFVDKCEPMLRELMPSIGYSVTEKVGEAFATIRTALSNASPLAPAEGAGDLEAVENALVAAKVWWDGRVTDGRVQPYGEVVTAIETVRRMRSRGGERDKDGSGINCSGCGEPIIGPHLANDDGSAMATGIGLNIRFHEECWRDLDGAIERRKAKESQGNPHVTGSSRPKEGGAG